MVCDSFSHANLGNPVGFHNVGLNDAGFMRELSDDPIFHQRGFHIPPAEPMKTIGLHSPSGLISPVIVHAVSFADIRK